MTDIDLNNSINHSDDFNSPEIKKILDSIRLLGHEDFLQIIIESNKEFLQFILPNSHEHDKNQFKEKTKIAAKKMILLYKLVFHAFGKVGFPANEFRKFFYEDMFVINRKFPDLSSETAALMQSLCNDNVLLKLDSWEKPFAENYISFVISERIATKLSEAATIEKREEELCSNCKRVDLKSLNNIFPIRIDELYENSQQKSTQSISLEEIKSQIFNTLGPPVLVIK